MKNISKSLYDKLADIAGKENVITDSPELISYSYDGQPLSARPDAVVTLFEKSQIVSVVKIAAEYGIPIVVRGAGSGMTGGSVPERGGIVINLERMNKIIGIDTEDLIGYVQPGVVTAAFQAAAAEKGLFFPPEPASAQFSTLGGNVAESAGGLTCVKYGLTKQYVMGLEFVTAGGEIVRTGVYSRDYSPLDIGAVLIGSEGTLAIITEIALRLVHRPDTTVTMLALFNSLADAARASNAVLYSGAGPAILEFMDKSCIDTVLSYVDIKIPEGTGAALIVEIDGDSAEVEAGHTKVLAVLEKLSPIEVRSAYTEKERKDLWKLRKSSSPAIAKIAPLKFNEDICVPLSKIPEMCTYIDNLGRDRNVKVVSFGHCGDGNIHVNFMTDKKRPEEVERVKKAVGDLFAEVVRNGGTLSGEHGIGIAKRPYLKIALDDATIDFEKRIKRAFDPENMLNPGKIFPE